MNTCPRCGSIHAGCSEQGKCQKPARKIRVQLQLVISSNEDPAMIEGEKEPLLFRIGVIHSGKKLPSDLVHRNQNAHFASLAFARISPSEARGGMATGDSGASQRTSVLRSSRLRRMETESFRRNLLRTVPYSVRSCGFRTQFLVFDNGHGAFSFH